MPLTRIVIAGLLVGMLAGCGSTPRSEYFVLTANATGQASGDTPALGLRSVTVPDYLSRSNMVFRQGSNQMQVSEYQRWAEPLASGAQRVLLLNLSALLATENVQNFPWRRDQQPTYAVAVTVLEWGTDGGRATLVAQWSVDREGNTLTRRVSKLETRTRDVGAAAVAAAYSGLLLVLSEEIATVIEAP